MKITALLLAAGMSKRMGGENKLLHPWLDSSVIRHCAKNLCQSGVDEVLVITGRDHLLIEDELADLPVRFVYNKAFASGMQSSLKIGWNHVSAVTSGVLIALGDMPFVGSREISLLMSEFQKQSGEKIIAPVFAGHRGHPVIFPIEFRERVLSEPNGDYGCNYLIKENPARLLEVSFPTAVTLRDVDQPEDFIYAP